MLHIEEQRTFVPGEEKELTFSGLMNRTETKLAPERAVAAIIGYGLDRYRAGAAGVWPNYVASEITGGGVKAPDIMAAAFRVDGLGIALLALKHAEGAGVAVSDEVRTQVEESVQQYTQDGKRATQDLTVTGDLTANWGHQAVAAAVRAHTEQIR